MEHFGSLESITTADYERVFITNVAGQLFATQAAAATMDEGARIVLTSSVSARIAVLELPSTPPAGQPYPHSCSTSRPNSPPAASPSTRSPQEAPAPTWPPKTPPSTPHPRCETCQPRGWSGCSPPGRLAEPDEIASVVAFLVSPDASFITGSTVAVDGCKL